MMYEGFKQNKADFWYVSDVVLNDLHDTENEKTLGKISQTTEKW